MFADTLLYCKRREQNVLISIGSTAKQMSIAHFARGGRLGLSCPAIVKICTVVEEIVAKLLCS